MNITIITYRDQDIELTTTKDEIKWMITRGDKKYGKGAIIPTKKLEDIAGIMGTIIINAIETIQELDKQGITNQTTPNPIKLKPCKSKTSSNKQKKSSK